MAPQPLSPALLASTADMINITSVFIGHGANPEKHQSKLLHIYLVPNQPLNPDKLEVWPAHCRFWRLLSRAVPEPESTHLIPSMCSCAISRRRSRHQNRCDQFRAAWELPSFLRSESPGGRRAPCRQPSPSRNPAPAATPAGSQPAVPPYPSSRRERLVDWDNFRDNCVSL